MKTTYVMNFAGQAGVAHVRTPPPKPWGWGLGGLGTSLNPVFLLSILIAKKDENFL